MRKNEPFYSKIPRLCSGTRCVIVWQDLSLVYSPWPLYSTLEAQMPLWLHKMEHLWLIDLFWIKTWTILSMLCRRRQVEAICKILLKIKKRKSSMTTCQTMWVKKKNNWKLKMRMCSLKGGHCQIKNIRWNQFRVKLKKNLTPKFPQLTRRKKASEKVWDEWRLIS